MSDFDSVIFYYFLKNDSHTFKKLLRTDISIEFGVPKECFLFTFLIIDVKCRHLITQDILDTNDCSLVRKFELLYDSH